MKRTEYMFVFVLLFGLPTEVEARELELAELEPALCIFNPSCFSWYNDTNSSTFRGSVKERKPPTNLTDESYTPVCHSTLSALDYFLSKRYISHTTPG